MLKKRIVGMVTVKDGWAVQSFEYGQYLPLGKPECLVENLDRWGADEIIVLSIDRTTRGLGPDFDLLRRLGALGLATPLAYGGGIRTKADAGAVITSGADRVCIDAVLWNDAGAVRASSELLGAQALIGVLPLTVSDSGPAWRNYRTRTDTPLADLDMALFADRVVSEALVVDWRHEGRPGGFDRRLVETWPLRDVPLILFGGLDDPASLTGLLADDRVVACAIGNFLSYREHAVQQYRRTLALQNLRPPEFKNQP
jgi:imidazole glycerol-phosphate synthase subunit HisF